MCMSCATSADALLGGGIVSAAGLRVAMRSWLPTVRERLGRPARGERADDSTDAAGAADDTAERRPAVDAARLQTRLAPHPA